MIFSLLSDGTLTSFSLWMIIQNLALEFGSSSLSGTAIEVSLLKALKIFPFLASMAALCLFVVPN